MRGHLKINYEMAWIRLKEEIESGNLSVNGEINDGDLLRAMEEIALDERED